MTIALALIWVASSGGTVADSVETCPEAVVLAAADLAGVVAVHDLARLVPFLDAVSVDGYDAEPRAGLAPRPLRVLVDGVPVTSTASIEPLGLEPLPVAVGEIRRVVACPGFGLAGGRWGGPWLDIETAPPGRVYAAGLYANETGNPGPDLYRDPSLRNVDRWGPDAEAALGAAVGRADLWASARLHRLLPTDGAIAPRILEVSVPGPNPVRLGTVGALAVRYGAIDARMGVHGAADLPFVPAVGREVPSDRRTIQAGVSTRWRRIRTHLHVADVRLVRPDGSRLDLGPDGQGPGWSEQRADAGASLALDRLAIGVQADATRADATGLADRAVAAGRAWARLGRAFDGGAVSLALQATASEAGPFLGGTVTARRRLGGAEGNASLALDRPPAEGLSVWLRRGYTGLAGAVRQDAAARDRPTVASARLGLSTQSRQIQASISAEGEWSHGLTEVARLALDGAAVAGRVGYETARGTAARLGARARWTGGAWQVTASGRVEGALGGTETYRAARARVPSAHANLRVTVRPDARLTLWASARARSSARWDGYPDPGIPAMLWVDLGLTKRAWGERLAFTVIGRNVLDAPERTHPLGAILAARLFVRAAVRL